jgi:hypothetical protein
MKILMTSIVAAAALSVSTMSFAQSQPAPITHAQVQAELIQLEQAGYRPEGKQLNYPADIQAAEAKIHSQSPGDTSYGGVSNIGSLASGTSAMPLQGNSLFAHH